MIYQAQSHQAEEGWRRSGRAISFQQLWQLVGGRIDLLKIDCEESEVNILTEMEELGLLGQIEVIHGEWHLPAARELIKRLLPKTHTLEIVEGHDQWDMFWARRRVLPTPAVYTLAYGESYRKMAQLMVESLRTYGCFRGEVYIFSDKTFPVDGEVRIMPVTGPANLAKAAAGLALGSASMLYLDADMLVLNPVGLLLNGSGCWAFVERARLDASNWHCFFPVSSPFMEGRSGFNTGAVLLNGSVCLQWALHMTRHEAWRQTCYDQNSFNALAYDGLEVLAWPEHWMRTTQHRALEQELHPETILLHCQGMAMERASAMSRMWELIR